MHLQKYVLAFGMTCIASVSRVAAFVVPAYDGWVTDRAALLSSGEVVQLTQQITAITQGYDAEIAILTLPSLDWEDIAQVGTQIAQERWIGNKDRDTGILILIAPTERQWRIDVWYGLEGALPDAYAYRYGQEYLVPAFRESHYADGVSALLTQIQQHLSGNPEQFAPQQDPWTIEFLWILGMFGVFILASSLKSQKTIEKSRAMSLISWSSGVYALIAGFFVWAIALFIFFTLIVVGLMIYSGAIVMNWWRSTGNSRWWWGSFSGWFGGFGGGSFGWWWWWGSR